MLLRAGMAHVTAAAAAAGNSCLATGNIGFVTLTQLHDGSFLKDVMPQLKAQAYAMHNAQEQ